MNNGSRARTDAPIAPLDSHAVIMLAQSLDSQCHRTWPNACLNVRERCKRVMKSGVAGTIVVVALAASTSERTVCGAAADHRWANPAQSTRAQAVSVDHPNLAVRVDALVRLSRGDARGVVTVPRHADNRMLRVILESEDYFWLSETPLEGKDAPQNHLLYWRGVPPGSYRVTVQVFGTAGLRASTSIGSTQPIGTVTDR
jgi:hypothetical protein